jgi:hypothetical protein
MSSILTGPVRKEQIEKKTEAKFLDAIGTILLAVSQSPLLTDFTPPPPQHHEWFETGYKHCIRKPQVWELSRLFPEPGFWTGTQNIAKEKQDRVRERGVCGAVKLISPRTAVLQALV